jgi:hypothetical protein
LLFKVIYIFWPAIWIVRLQSTATGQQESMMQPDRLTIYLALAVVACGIAAVTGPSSALFTLLQVVLVVETVNLISAPGDESRGTAKALATSQGE